jgi:hypothetical protein
MREQGQAGKLLRDLIEIIHFIERASPTWVFHRTLTCSTPRSWLFYKQEREPTDCGFAVRWAGEGA